MTVLKVEGSDKQAFIYSDEDFIRLVEERMGHDAGEYLRDMIQRIIQCENTGEEAREIICSALRFQADDIADFIVERLGNQRIV